MSRNRKKTHEAGGSPGGRGRVKRSPLRIVGIGASAGGLEAFTRLLSHLPRKTGMAFVLLQHLDPTRPSLLPGLLAKATRLPVVEASDGMRVKPNHVYAMPPNVNMAIAGGVLHLTPRGDLHHVHLPLDLFFRSLAADRRGRAIGVILSGAGADGSLGLAEIKAAGGITFAQDEPSSSYPDMPRNAVTKGCVDYVLSPEAIALKLGRLAHQEKDGSVLASKSVAPCVPPTAESDYQKILGWLRHSSRVDFGAYRDTTIKRRIARRMALQKQQTLAQYVRFIEGHPAELEALYREMLINVTSFFRDPAVFKTLKTHVFPQIIQGKSAQTPIRIWVPGCATGQEAYSLAMVLLEVLDAQSPRPPIQIFGTDVNDPVAIETARSGLYPAKIEVEVSPQRLRCFFTREDAGYRISKEIREMCVFARQNVAADPPFSSLDLISCRNLLIYLSAPLQKRVIPTFHYALNPGGFLVLGTSETVGRFTDLFEVVNQKLAIYRRPDTP